MVEEFSNLRCGIEHPSSENDNTYTRVTKALAEETGITGEEGRGLEPVQVANYLLLILPLGAANFEADVVGPKAPTTQEENLVPRNIVV
jgi:hypothetical protein